MDTEQEQFDQVRKLLALKKYEQPPPRYFQDFSSKVIARLQALEAARRVTWRQRLGLDFDFKPAIVGAFGVVVCGLLLVGILTSQGESQSPNVVLGSDSSGLLASPTANPILAGGAG